MVVIGFGEGGRPEVVLIVGAEDEAAARMVGEGERGRKALLGGLCGQRFAEVMMQETGRDCKAFIMETRAGGLL